MRLLRGAVLAAGVLLAGCQGLYGGEPVARFPLQAGAEGGYLPVRFLLQPAMNPVTIRLHADLAWGARAEGGQWNTYRATLRRDGQALQSREFSINSPENADRIVKSPAPSSAYRELMVIDVPKDAEYELVIQALTPEVVTLRTPQLEVHAGTRRSMTP